MLLLLLLLWLLALLRAPDPEVAPCRSSRPGGGAVRVTRAPDSCSTSQCNLSCSSNHPLLTCCTPSRLNAAASAWQPKSPRSSDRRSLCCRSVSPCCLLRMRTRISLSPCVAPGSGAAGDGGASVLLLLLLPAAVQPVPMPPMSPFELLLLLLLVLQELLSPMPGTAGVLLLAVPGSLLASASSAPGRSGEVNAFEVHEPVLEQSCLCTLSLPWW